MRIFLFAILMSISTLTFANLQVNMDSFNQLTEAQQADVIKSIAEQASHNTIQQPSQRITDPKQVEQWGSIGVSVATAIGSAAKELNVGINDFAQSPVGKLTIAIIIFKLFGGKLGAILFLIIGISIIKIAMNKMYPTLVTYSTKDKNIFGNYVIIQREPTQIGDDGKVGFMLSYFTIFIVCVIVFAAN